MIKIHVRKISLVWLSIEIIGLSILFGCHPAPTVVFIDREASAKDSAAESAQTTQTEIKLQDTPSPQPIPTGDQETVAWSSVSSSTPAIVKATETLLTSTPSFTATEDTRLPPDQWKDWDYLPRVSARAIEIYRKGIANGTNPRHFSVIGDCQAIPFVFLGRYDRKEYTLPPGQGYLQETIDYFAGSFNREGMAVRGGFTAASILSPLQSDPKYCKPGETPLDCELRLHNPSIVIISLETWSKPDTIDRYETYLRQIVEAAIERGVLPILANKADVAEVGGGKHVINPAIARVAYDYDLPWFNFWRSAQYLPNFGIDPNRDGFHLSEEGYELKSQMALQALDIVWRAVRVDSPMVSTSTESPTQIFTATQPETATVTPTPTITSSPTYLPICQPNQEGAVHCIAFGYAIREQGALQNNGVYLLDTERHQSAKIAPDGYDIQDISPDNQFILLNDGSDLFIASYTGIVQQQITDQFYDFSTKGAYWLRDQSGIVWIGQQDGRTTVNLFDITSSVSKVISQPEDNPVVLYPYVDTNSIFWGDGTCTGFHFCEIGKVVEISLEDLNQTPHDYFIHPVFSPDAVHVALFDPMFKSQPGYLYNDRLAVEDLTNPIASRRLVMFPPARGFMVSARLIDYSWSPDGSKLFVLLDDYSDYFERSLVLRGYIFDLPTGMLLDYAKVYGAYGSLNPQAIWSPDGKQILLALTGHLDNGGYAVKFFMLDIGSKELVDISSDVNLVHSDYAYLTHVFWVSPQP